MMINRKRIPPPIPVPYWFSQLETLQDINAVTRALRWCTIIPLAILLPYPRISALECIWTRYAKAEFFGF